MGERIVKETTVSTNWRNETLNSYINQFRVTNNAFRKISTDVNEHIDDKCFFLAYMSNFTAGKPKKYGFCLQLQQQTSRFQRRAIRGLSHEPGLGPYIGPLSARP